MMPEILRPAVIRPKLRRRIGRWFYIQKRCFQWIFGKQKFAEYRKDMLGEVVFQHQTPLLRRLKNVDMYLQYNKITNLRLAAAKIDGLVIMPGETFSFWRMVGRPSAGRGFQEGLVLDNGKIDKGIGGGLCQMGNLLYWMVLHSPLRVTERWRHSYDVFPDENRSLPFGSGATLAYNYIDLQFRNDTQQSFQLHIRLSETELHGEIRCDALPEERYEVFEKEHEIRHEPWGGYSRHNLIARKVFSLKTGELLREEPVTENHALMMYQPFIESASGSEHEG